MSSRKSRSPITEDVLKEFILHLDSGLTKHEAAEKVNFRLRALRNAAIRLGYSIPCFTSLLEAVSARLPEIKTKKRTREWWRKEFNVSPSRFNKVLRDLNIHRSYFRSKTSSNSTDHSKKIENYRKILEHVQQNGGYVTHSMKALGYSFHPQPVRDFAKVIGIELTHWQFAWKEFGLWLTLPGPWTLIPPANYKVPAICRGCGEISHVDLCNAKSGKTTCCKNCAVFEKQYLQIINNSTGEIHPSIRSWVKSIGRDKEYIKLRLTMKQVGSATINDVHYSVYEDDA